MKCWLSLFPRGPLSNLHNNNNVKSLPLIKRTSQILLCILYPWKFIFKKCTVPEKKSNREKTCFHLGFLGYFGNQVKSNSHRMLRISGKSERGKEEAKIEFLQIGFGERELRRRCSTLDNQSWLSRFGKTTHIRVGGIASARKEGRWGRKAGGL